MISGVCVKITVIEISFEKIKESVVKTLYKKLLLSLEFKVHLKKFITSVVKVSIIPG